MNYKYLYLWPLIRILLGLIIECKPFIKLKKTIPSENMNENNPRKLEESNEYDTI